MSARAGDEAIGGDVPTVELWPIRTWSVRCSACGQVCYGTTRLRAESIRADHEESHLHPRKMTMEELFTDG